MQYQPPRDNSAAPRRTRLTYSAQQQQAARGELFANSQYASQQDTSTPVRVEDMDNQQIMQHAVATHKDTTATAKRALQAGKPNGKQQAGQRVQQAAAYPGVSTQGLADVGFQQEADELQAETQQQDKYLDQISNGLDQLKEGAK
eukprot:gene2562-2864_t